MSVWGPKGINNCFGSTLDGTVAYPYVLGVRGNNGTGAFVSVDRWRSEENGVVEPTELPPEKV